ncbi:MAG: nucleotidyltransferase [Phycisphaerae bacterium]|nr:nucleotidyltransferase [Phycisphaerae bacterium]
MELPTCFKDFLTDIRPTTEQNKRMKEAHIDLQTRLRSDENLSPVLVTTFVQGSYRRHTALKAGNDDHCDVDVVVVTRFDKNVQTPQQVLDAFKPFLEKNYKGRYEPQGRSWGIEWDDLVKLDLVPTAAPSESMMRIFEAEGIGAWSSEIGPWLTEDMQDKGLRVDPLFEAIQAARKDPHWALEPLDIPDRDSQIWDRTHPLAQIEWTTEKNRQVNGHYINMVKALKWWRRETEPLPKYPKSYPLEHMLGLNCSNGLTSVALCVVDALERAVANYEEEAEVPQTPFLPDHGFPEDQAPDVFGRLDPEDFAQFYKKLIGAAKVARYAIDCKSMRRSSELWRKLLGEDFPKAGADNDSGDGPEGGFTPPSAPRGVEQTRFAEP